MSPKKSLPSWIKLVFAVTCFGVLFGLIGLALKERASDVVEEQLSKIRESKITQAYYDFTSIDFQTNTTLDAFREFVNSYPVLTNNKNFSLQSSDIKDNKATIKGVLLSDNLHEMEATYRLIKENDSWKILHMKLADLSTKPSDLSSIALVKQVTEQLKALQKNDLTDAYYGFVSKDFQNESPLEDFKQFVNTHPILHRYKGIEVTNHTIKDDQGIVEAVLNSDQGDFFLEYRLVREGDDWKIWSLKLTLSPEEAEKAAFTNPKAMEPPIRSFFDALIKKNIQYAYDNTAKEFQDATSLASFLEFTEHHPVLMDRDLIDIKNGQIEDGVGSLSVNLHDESGITTVLFKLGFENGEWKIWGVEIPKESAASTIKTADLIKDRKSDNLSRKLQSIVQSHLKNLRYHKISEAYSAMSENYRMRHTLANFEDYLQKNPAFNMNKSSQFDRVSINKKNIALQGNIVSFDAETYPVKYSLVKEGKNWRIDQFAILQDIEPIAENDYALNEVPAQQTLPSLKIAGIKVGTEADQDGRLANSSITIDKDAPFIYINVSIKNGKDGTVLKAVLEHVESESSAPWLATSLEGNGNYVVVFSYAMPKNGWPLGEYIIKITSITGQEAIQKFIVE